MGAMRDEVLVAGVGNVFFQDDGFGVELAHRAAKTPRAGVRIIDFGIRGLHLAYELLEPPPLLIVADAVMRGGEPGTLYVIEADGAGIEGVTPDAHSMNLRSVFATVRAMGGELPRVLVLGCEPLCTDEGLGLSAPVAAALDPAALLLTDLLRRERVAAPGGLARETQP